MRCRQSFLHAALTRGDLLEVAAPRGTFTLQAGERPVVLISVGVGATPVMAMLHALPAERTERETWWIHGARNRRRHSFRVGSARLLEPCHAISPGAGRRAAG